jgi:hypothetical protein
MCCCSDDCIQRFPQALLHMWLQPDVFLLNDVTVIVYKSQTKHVKYTAIMLRFKYVIMRLVIENVSVVIKHSLCSTLHSDIFKIKID